MMPSYVVLPIALGTFVDRIVENTAIPLQFHCQNHILFRTWKLIVLFWNMDSLSDHLMWHFYKYANIS